jgi:hypothetical protein
MSTSYVEFRGKGFWSWDGYLEDVLQLLALHPVATDSPAWLTNARQHWLEQASGIFRGWIHPELDEILYAEERRLAFVAVVQAISLRTDLTPEAQATLRLLERLVQGEITTDASSPLDYMVSGNHPYRATLRPPSAGQSDPPFREFLTKSRAGGQRAVHSSVVRNLPRPTVSNSSAGKAVATPSWRRAWLMASAPLSAWGTW